MTGDRLALGTLGWVPEELRPVVDPRSLDVGVTHLGVGAFHRAHQAVYTEGAVAASGDTRWGIAGFTSRSGAVADLLGPQDGLYTVLERDDDTARARVVGVLRDVRSGSGDPGAVLDRLAHGSTAVVTLTVTEKGYRHNPATGRLSLYDAEIAADLAGRPPVTVVGRLVRGLQRRMRDDAGPVSVLCCDNFPSSGRVLAGLVDDFVAALPSAEGDRLGAWIEAHAAFPDSMVDRITPATTDADLRDARDLLGLRDEAVVVTEPFSQWVIEDRFAADRPPWERAGVQLTASVEPYERAKLRLLNGSHSTVAYLGALAGYDTIAAAMRDEAIEAVVARLMADDVTPTLDPPEGVDLVEYGRTVLHRFRNEALGHTTRQVAMDGSQKLGPRLLGTIADALAAGREPRWATLGVAAWMRYVSASASDSGTPLTLDDPLAERIRTATRSVSTAAGIVDGLLGVTEIFDPALARGSFRDLLVDWLDRLRGDGVRATLRRAIAAS
ncbi:MAG: mannitol dehydrogenase family protein [Streptosporangiales bacterium]|nr:mannitol dehydrogenase family protein [Streptosporangiales bacterium]